MGRKGALEARRKRWIRICSAFTGIVVLILIIRSLSDGSSISAEHTRLREQMNDDQSLSSVTGKTETLSAVTETLQEVQSKLQYWKLGPLASSGLYRLPHNIGDKYIIFESDCGGFNNIRMVFEYAIFMAWVTRRTLVLPPPKGWYLLDWGPFARMKPGEENKRRTSDYGIFFDMEHLRAAVPVISAAEFIKLEGSRLKMPEELLHASMDTDEGLKLYNNWMFAKDVESEHGDSIRRILPWAPLSVVVYFPSIEAVTRQFPSIPEAFIDRRKIVEFTPEILDSPVISFPSCKTDSAHRYLGQMNAVMAFADEALSRSYKRMLRDNVHYQQIVFDIAARVIHAMGSFQFSSFHIRRNDLQYKEVFLHSQAIIENVGPLLKPGEKLYIATDEVDDQFFNEFEKQYQVFRWKDFFTAKGNFALKGVDIPVKLEGCIEQVICALGRVFVGTLESTFTSYIFRLRGYYNAPNTEIYFHSLPYTGDVEKDRRSTWSKKPVRGQTYISEDPTIWIDANSPHTSW